MNSLEINLKNAVRNLGFALLLSFVTTFAVLFAGMAAYSVATAVIPADAPIWNEVRCAIGLPTPNASSCARSIQHD